jgi:hypothetical protein
VGESERHSDQQVDGARVGCSVRLERQLFGEFSDRSGRNAHTRGPLIGKTGVLHRSELRIMPRA